MTIRRALISVSNKEGLVELGRALCDRNVALISSGGTASALRAAGVDVTVVSDYTGAPEMLGGRVKTLHPRVFGGILARDSESDLADLATQQTPLIDLVVVNLYPFQQTIARPAVSIAEAIEQIDIGGPSMVRAAAKNHARVGVVVDPADYAALLTEFDANQGALSDDFRRKLALKAFAHTASYDAAIAEFLAMRWDDEALPARLNLALERGLELRYGENPHQKAAFYSAAGELPWEQLNGKALSYNNLLDLDAAWQLACDLPKTAVCVIKHTNPCGVASGDRPLAEIFQRAWACDPLSAFGGIVAANVPIDLATAQQLREFFLEVVVAPEFDDDALALLKKKRSLRLVKIGTCRAGLTMRSAVGGLLVQDRDVSIEAIGDARVVSKAQPNAAQLADLDFAWRVCKHVKSNAISFARDSQLTGVGAGQMSRVDAVRIACEKSGDRLRGSAAASDAFFPFRDGVDALAKAGVTAVVQPGGSVRDDEVIAAADEHGLVMVFTGVRHFRH